MLIFSFLIRDVVKYFTGGVTGINDKNFGGQNFQLFLPKTLFYNIYSHLKDGSLNTHGLGPYGFEE